MGNEGRQAAPRQKSSFARIFCCGGGDDGNDGASIQPSAISTASANSVMDMTTSQKDSLFRYQLDLSNPKPLGVLSFYVVGITNSRQDSLRILDTLKRFGILAAQTDDPTVSTRRITRQLTNGLPFLPRNAQRILIALLFFWEEELARWTQLEREADHIEAQMQELERDLARQSSQDQIEQPGDSQARLEELAAARTRLRTLWSIAPSMRESKRGTRKGSMASSTPSRRQLSQTTVEY